MVMRVWPARVKVEITTFPDAGEDVGDAILSKQMYSLVVTGLCADGVLRKVKDHFLAKDKFSSFKFIGPVDWVTDKERDTIVVDF